MTAQGPRAQGSLSEQHKSQGQAGKWEGCAAKTRAAVTWNMVAIQPKRRQMCLLGKRGQDSLRDACIHVQAHICVFIEMYMCLFYIPAWL